MSLNALMARMVSRDVTGKPDYGDACKADPPMRVAAGDAG